ncbi:MAG: hypothetical protein RL701_4356 [Pseudomonadota bacterium]
MHRLAIWLWAAVLSAQVVLVSRDAHAQAEDSDAAGEAEAAESEASWGKAEVGPEKSPTEDNKADPTTPPTWWFGAYLQGAFVPSFMLQLFLAEAPAVSNVGFGFTATHRSPDGMSIVLGLGYQGYGFDGPYRAKGDPDEDTEYLRSSLGLLHLRAQVMWSANIVQNMLSFEYGLGLDFGVVLGSMVRNEAYRDGAGAFQPCAGPLVPNPIYCEPPQTLGARTDAYNQYGAHYGVVEKSIPPVMAIPMIPALALRYTPIRSLAIKLDAAFGLLQFSVGLSAAYGVDL